MDTRDLESSRPVRPRSDVALLRSPRRTLWVLSACCLLGVLLPEAHAAPASTKPCISIQCFKPWARLSVGVTPGSVAVVGTKIYFTNDTYSSWNDASPIVLSVDRTTHAVVPLVSKNHTTRADSIVTDGTSLYWIEQGPSSTGQATLFRWPGSGDPMAISQDSGEFALGSRTQDVVLADVPGSAKHVYYSSPEAHSMIYDAAAFPFFGAQLWLTRELIPSGGDASSGFSNYYPTSLAADASQLYFIKDDGKVFRVPLTGSLPVTPIYLAQGTAPFDAGQFMQPIAADGTFVFYANGSSVERVPVTGGAPATLATDAGAPTSILVRDGFVYWTCTSCGTVSKIPSGGGTVKMLAWSQSSPKHLAADETRVYWGVTDGVAYAIK